MTDHRKYFERYAYGPPIFPGYTPGEVPLVIVLPSYQESGLCHAVQSLAACDPPGFDVVLLVVVNEPEDCEATLSKINQDSIRALEALVLPPFLHLKLHYARLPSKKAGVGLARKIGMDEAARWFNDTGKNGIITCFDADCRCAPNFLQAIAQYFTGQMDAGIVFYEHPLEHQEILKYELFLRYHIDALRYAGFPYAYQTLGSCISVRTDAYLKHGGMNTRKAGEDFYFLHKIIPHCRFGEINMTTIYPSSRQSDRVPFGTGKAITRIANEVSYQVYAPQAFEALKVFFNQAAGFYPSREVQLPESIQAFHEENDFSSALEEMKVSSTTPEVFKKKFFAWWDAFRALKYVHFARDHYFPNIPLEEAITWLDGQLWQLELEGSSMQEQLQQIRFWDRSYPAPS